jgi:hypothetical protein
MNEKVDVSNLNSSALFTQYVDIVNRAIGAHRDEFPLEQLMDAADDMLEDKKIGVAIYKEDPDEPHDWFTVRYDDGTFAIANHGKSKSVDVDWHVKENYLRKVVSEPQPYIDKPSKLDFDWLRSRMGLD